MPFVPSRDGLCFSFIGNLDVCPFSLSCSPRCSRFVFLALSSLSYFLVLIVWETRGFLLLMFDPLVLYIFRGRRQLPQAGEVRRPPGRGVRLWLV